MRKGVLSAGIVLLLMSAVLFTFYALETRSEGQKERFALGSGERNGVYADLERGDTLVIDYTSDQPVTVYMAQWEDRYDVEAAEKVLERGGTGGQHTFRIPSFGRWAVMFLNEDNGTALISVEVQYRTYLAEILWYVSILVFAVGLSTTIAGGLMVRRERAESRDDAEAHHLASEYRVGDKASGKAASPVDKAVGRMGVEAARGSRAASRGVKRKKVRRPAPSVPSGPGPDDEEEPPTRIPMFGPYSFGTLGEKSTEPEADMGDTAEDEVLWTGDAPPLEESSDATVPRRSGDDTWTTSGWDDFGEEAGEVPEEDVEDGEGDGEERPSEWLRRLLEST
ncbi:MAG TPA: hypothetical protein EYP43_03025 [Thermoplasmata archaeon]|nr:hypothetical protein [Thermoplasmata archaeon]